MMKRVLRSLLLAVALLGAAGAPLAQEGPAPAGQKPIPYKRSSEPLAEQGVEMGVALLITLLVGGAAILLLRKHGTSLRAVKGKRLQLIEQVRLNAQCSVYLVKLDNTELLLSQCGDKVLQLNVEQENRLPAGEVLRG